MIKVEINIQSEIYAKLYEEAQRRKKKPEQLAAALVSVIIADDLVKAVMDDKK